MITALHKVLSFIYIFLFLSICTLIICMFMEGPVGGHITVPKTYSFPVGWSCRIYRLHLCRGVGPTPMNVLDMTLNNLMVRFQ